MSINVRTIATSIIVGGMLTVPASSALAGTPSNFGSHVRECAQSMGFSGSHNPGMHRGAAGWDGQPCR